MIKKLIFLVVLFTLLAYQKKSTSKLEDLEKISIGVQNNTITALLYIAKQSGYYEKYSLDVDISDFPSALITLKNMLNGQVYFATHKHKLVNNEKINFLNNIEIDPLLIVSKTKVKKLHN